MREIAVTRLLLCTTLLAGPAAAEPMHRLLVADAEAATLRVIDLEGGETSEFALDAPARIHLGPDGRHAFLVQRDAGRVAVLDTGRVSEDHGDHAAVDLEAPAMLDVTLTGDEPVHFNMDADRIAVFWDGSGEATLHDKAAILEGDAAPATTLATAEPHHGVAVPVGEHAIVSVPTPEESLPDALAVMDASGAELSTVPCARMHGEGHAGDLIAFGCADGVAVFDASADPPEGRLVPYPDELPEDGLVRSFLSPRDVMALVGTFGSDGMVIFDPSSEEGDFTHVALPAPRVAFALDDPGEVGFAILADGRVLRFSALTGAVLGEAEGVTGPYSMESGVVRPAIDAAGERVAVSDPAAGEVAVLDAETLEVLERVAVGGTPRPVLLLAAEGDVGH